MKKRTLISLLGIIALFALACAPAIAYYSAKTSTVPNKFSINTGGQEETKGTLVETKWPKDGALNLMPGETVEKNPVITSNLDYDSKAYLGVTIPQVSATLDGTATVTDAVYLKDIGEGWELIETIPGSSREPELQIYSYGTKLATDESTTPTFSYIEIPDFSQYSDTKEKYINVKGYLIQADYIDKEEADSEAISFFRKEFLEDE